MATVPDIRAEEIEYPSSDGKPVAETDIHIDVLLDVRSRLKARFADRDDVYVAGNMLVYYAEGQPRVSLAPDGFVVFGVPNHRRKVFKTWAEGKFPSVVFEFTSKSTQNEDLEEKFDIYQNIWKVSEYFLFDPEEEYLDPSLLGYRMSRGELKPIKPVRFRLTSKALGLTLARDGTRLVLRDAETGEELLTPDAIAARQERARDLAERARDLAELAHLRGELTRQGAELAQIRAELAALRQKPSSP
ncbi:Uma2 family endonuclease [Fimbriiglobus ruber]|uniref:Putative restriction endonuclease domain-containing protein n=1 Tax=Fimbriiglobus ruber TaxID=1908690 RepID=A0A225DP91_9BACT|nr:Uma2 family endonuclease [Fimbriiglobus ruber]OWK43290.1 hypothetical protein FRUB_02889 [Fimbriiglobus ruber]